MKGIGNDGTTPVRLLGLSGSLRKGSYSTAILRAIEQTPPEGVELSIFDLGAIPIYNQDLDVETDRPASVAELKAAITASDGLVVVTPEYNYGLSGMLKNTVDWASRPAFNSVLVGKPVLGITSSPGPSGGVRAHVQLLELFSSVLARPVPHQQVRIGGIHLKIEEGVLTDEPTLAIVRAGLDTLLSEIDMLRIYRSMQKPPSTPETMV
jgi:chromate reductase